MRAPEQKTELRVAMLCLSEERTAYKVSPHTSGCKYRASLVLMKFSSVENKVSMIPPAQWGIQGGIGQGLNMELSADEERKDI